MKNRHGNPSNSRKRESKITASYDQFKQFEGQRYTGMKIGRSHKWYYDRGEWKEKKVTPDKWEINYEVTKRRAGRAPEGSGVPVGTEYHWYILAHQNVKKLNANDYSTALTGQKFKLAHKRADGDKWSASPRAQRNRLIKILRQMAEELESQMDSESPAAGRPDRVQGKVEGRSDRSKRRRKSPSGRVRRRAA